MFSVIEDKHCGWGDCKCTKNLVYCGHCGVSFCPKHWKMDNHSFSVVPKKDIPGWVKYDIHRPGRLSEEQRANHERNHLNRRKMQRTHTA